MTMPAFTLETVYADALDKLQGLRDSGRLSSRDYNVITGTHNLQDLNLLLVNAAASTDEGSRSPSGMIRMRNLVESLLLRLERFGSALDMLAQSSPTIMGVNVVGLIWGSLRFLIIIARDIRDTFDNVLRMLEEIVNGLPVLHMYIGLFGTSENQLLKSPLVNIYTELVLFGIKALEMFGGNFTRTLARSTWKSMHGTFKQMISNIQLLGKEIDRKAAVEHMHQSNKAVKIQAHENQKAETFRQEIRTLLTQQSVSGSLHNVPTCLSIQEAPIGSLSAHFIGRSRELGRLDDLFFGDNDRTTKCCAIYGMPGVGKTQMVLCYAKAAFERGRYQNVFWISARTNERVHQGLAKLLHLVGNVDRDHSEDLTRMTAARRWLEQQPADDRTPWLLVFDNVERGTVEMLQSHLPRNSHNGHIIFTTRTEDAARALVERYGERNEMVRLQALGVDDAAQLLLNAAGSTAFPDLDPAVQGQARDLVKIVGCLPLAVDHAALFLKQTRKTLSDLSALYVSEERIKVLAWDNDLSTYEQKSVAATFAWQLDELNHRAPDACKIMKLCSFLDPESFNTALLIHKKAGAFDQLKHASRSTQKSTVKSQLKRMWLMRSTKQPSSKKPIEFPIEAYLQLESLVPLIQSATKLSTAFLQLQRSSLIEEKAGIQEPFFRMHELIKVIVEDRMRAEGTLQAWFRCTEFLVCGAFSEVPDPGHPSTWRQCEAFIPHIEALCKWAEARQLQTTWLGQASLGVASYFRARARYSDAEAIYLSTLDKFKTERGPNDLSTLQATQDLASVYELQGRYLEAEALYRFAHHETRDLLGQDNLRTLQNQQNLAIIYMRLGRDADAEPLLREALAGRTHRLGSDHKDSLRTAHNLASVLKRQNRFSEAEDIYLKTLEKREEILGPDHRDTLSTIQDFGSLRLAQGRLNDAEHFYKRVLAGRENHFGLDHPQTFRTWQNIAVLYAEQGHDDKAEEYYTRALTGWTESVGSSHPETLLTVQNLAILRERQGKHEAAEMHFKDALAGFEKQLGFSHPSTMRARERYSAFLLQQGRGEEAGTLLQSLSPAG